MVNQNTGRGLLLSAIALIFLLQAPRFKLGDLSHPGPGLFPIIIAGGLLVIGIVIVVRAHFIEAEPLDFQFRNIALVIASLIGFAFIAEHLNMLAAIVFLAFVASLASDDFSIRRSAVIAGALCLFAFAMQKGLGVQLPLY